MELHKLIRDYHFFVSEYIGICVRTPRLLQLQTPSPNGLQRFP
jgi:hypothetical protein